MNWKTAFHRGDREATEKNNYDSWKIENSQGFLFVPGTIGSSPCSPYLRGKRVLSCLLILLFLGAEPLMAEESPAATPGTEVMRYKPAVEKWPGDQDWTYKKSYWI